MADQGRFRGKTMANHAGNDATSRNSSNTLHFSLPPGAQRLTESKEAAMITATNALSHSESSTISGAADDRLFENDTTDATIEETSAQFQDLAVQVRISFECVRSSFRASRARPSR